MYFSFTIPHQVVSIWSKDDLYNLRLLFTHLLKRYQRNGGWNQKSTFESTVEPDDCRKLDFAGTISKA